MSREIAGDRQHGEVHPYDAIFYRANSSLAARSARRVVPRLAGVLSVRSVVDFGCGEGAWLKVWSDLGASVRGVDGTNVDTRRLLIDPAAFHLANLAQPIDLGFAFDLAQSLEVAEHLPAASAERFIDTLTAHSPKVLFSAAVPGQGGEHHINEQPLEYWRTLFRKRGYTAFDYIRPLIGEDAAIEWWYRYNILLYVRDDGIAALPEAVRSCRIPDTEELRDYRPVPVRIKNALVRRLPGSAVDRASRMKWRIAAHLARVRRAAQGKSSSAGI